MPSQLERASFTGSLQRPFPTDVEHAALLHVPRRQERDREQWNIAAAIVVNGMPAGEGFTLLEIGIRDVRL